jgi:hypothetical protein
VLIVSLQAGHGKTATVPDKPRLDKMTRPFFFIDKEYQKKPTGLLPQALPKIRDSVVRS